MMQLTYTGKLLTLFFSFHLASLVTGLVPVKSAGIGMGAAQEGGAVLGLGLANGGISSAGSGAKGDKGTISTLVSGGNDEVGEDEEDELPVSPEADVSLNPNKLLPKILGSLVRPLESVPDYRAGQSMTSPENSNPTPMPAEYEDAAKPPKTCWTLSKRCCYEEVHSGYKCKDYYEYKYARCHPMIKYQAVCDAIVEEPKHHPQPKGRVKTEETIIKNYDQDYGPHINGYPKHGESDYYESNAIPQRPKGVGSDPYPAPQEYVAKPSTSNNGMESYPSGQQKTYSSDTKSSKPNSPANTYKPGVGDSYHTSPPSTTSQNNQNEKKTKSKQTDEHKKEGENTVASTYLAANVGETTATHRVSVIE